MVPLFLVSPDHGTDIDPGSYRKVHDPVVNVFAGCQEGKSSLEFNPEARQVFETKTAGKCRLKKQFGPVVQAVQVVITQLAGRITGSYLTVFYDAAPQ